MSPLAPSEEARLRHEIERRIGVYAARGLRVSGIKQVLNTEGPIAVLEKYARADPDVVRGWRALVHDEPEMALEWLVLNDPAAFRETSKAAHDAASWKLSMPDFR